MRPEYTPISILAGSAIIGIGLYFGLRTPPADPAGAKPEVEARATKPKSPAESPFAQRDRHRMYDDDTPSSDGEEAPTPDERREQPVLTDAERAMAVAAPLTGVPEVPQGLHAEVERGAREAFESVRSEVRDECWNKLPEDPEAPSSVELDLSLSYDAEGKLIASGVSEDRAGRRDGLANCLGPIVHGLSIPAPGARASVQVRVTVP